ncbi:MAG: endonuclease/exonuclease/phosphatase family protein, partial [Rhodothermales bacterium]
KKAAAVIQRLRPDILLINEITYDQPGVPGYEGSEGQNGRRFAETFLAVSQGDGLEPIRYQAFMAPSNTGMASGFDLNNDGIIVTEFPEPAPPNPDGTPLRQTPEQRLYGADTWGFGTFPGQYSMALFVREGLDILLDSVRTFQYFPWSRMPDARMPVDPATGQPWYTGDEGEQFRLSSKSHWDVPVRQPDGHILHILASHPTPPAFDGEERRNGLRNHDEIRFWANYLDGAFYIVDDAGRTGGLHTSAAFVILGDLNADPDEGSSIDDPIGTWLLAHPRVNGGFVPRATEEGVAAFPRLDPDDTATWGPRVDYVLPSSNLRLLEGGILRPVGADTTGISVSDHFPVWIDVVME